MCNSRIDYVRSSAGPVSELLAGGHQPGDDSDSHSDAHPGADSHPSADARRGARAHRGTTRSVS
ncbi:hypothetical protein [Arthrobacter zhaoguopingii]|uniref:hypothetical protein n=1 Tax=Arthrobacter zhaoguopingii TaxID=2681491 RepID=UPI0013574B7A|nr:hypothetical protein [Arthrobacter zhaoguopingii]